jgi:hypothetical protein
MGPAGSGTGVATGVATGAVGAGEPGRPGAPVGPVAPVGPATGVAAGVGTVPGRRLAGQPVTIARERRAPAAIQRVFRLGLVVKVIR